MRALSVFAVVALAIGTAGCGRSFVPATPPTFVELNHEHSYAYRATTADGVVLAVRELANEPKGDLAFWSQAVELRLRSLGGYALLEKKEVTCLGGLRGTELKMGHDEANRPHLYYVTVFVSDQHIFVLEAGGAKLDVERYEAAIDWSIRNFRPKG